MKCLRRNRDTFAARGVAVPRPARYRKLIRDALDAMSDTEPALDARDVLLDAILDRDVADRLILSNAHFFGAPRVAIRDGMLYPKAAQRLRHFGRLFARDEIEIFMALRNPASFLPAAFARSPKSRITEFVGGVPPTEVRWSELLSVMRSELPRATITVWCNEDAPLIWASIIRAMAALEPDERIVGAFALLATIMSRDGMQRFRAYLKDNPAISEPHKRRVMAVFLEKYALAEEVEVELDLPGWTAALVEQMTETYDADVAQIRQMPGIRMISP